jgi:hypothetical protein
MVWNGSVWSIVPSPNASNGENSLQSVSCVSASECVAVGYIDTGSTYETLAMVWNGSVWSIVPSPNAGTNGDLLLAVSCMSASDCLAVGYTGVGNNVYETLVLSLTGPVPPPSTTTTVASDPAVPAFTG